ncbi:potassium channel family protein [Haloechinothrix sp. YIM 98757]|uniref:Potassium channel family protein n=1 Tax=Haloechinothrix aidingensis TaxID=2752311 RepID=A0A838A7B3_9PSEU|nr:potassium channel family protein [Haloechinothrix aidingensis]MBA0124159.1 potassium channel family protein [Haloechinothrix aidingensis]
MTDRLSRYEARTTSVLLALALAFIVVYGVPVIRPDLPEALRTAFAVANWAIWAAFALDLIIRTSLSDNRLLYLAQHPVDVLVVLVPALRMLRVLRAFTAAQVLITRSGQLSLLRTTQAIALATSLLVFIGALALLDAERGAPGSTVENLGDALWWSLVTVTTVGYGDVVPVTGMGRVVAAGLMLVGISLLGVVTAMVASWFLGHNRSALEEQGSAQRESSAQLEEKVADLEQRLEDIHGLLVQQRTGTAPPSQVDKST